MDFNEYKTKFPFAQTHSLNTLNKLEAKQKKAMKNPTEKQLEVQLKAKENFFKSQKRIEKVKSRDKDKLSEYHKERVKRTNWENPALKDEAKKKIKNKVVGRERDDKGKFIKKED